MVRYLFRKKVFLFWILVLGWWAPSHAYLEIVWQDEEGHWVPTAPLNPHLPQVLADMGVSATDTIDNNGKRLFSLSTPSGVDLDLLGLRLILRDHNLRIVPGGELVQGLSRLTLSRGYKVLARYLPDEEAAGPASIVPIVERIVVE